MFLVYWQFWSREDNSLQVYSFPLFTQLHSLPLWVFTLSKRCSWFLRCWNVAPHHCMIGPRRFESVKQRHIAVGRKSRSFLIFLRSSHEEREVVHGGKVVSVQPSVSSRDWVGFGWMWYLVFCVKCPTIWFWCMPLRFTWNSNRSVVESSWNVMAHGDAREGTWRGNWRMEWVASTLYTTSEHGVSSVTTADAHTSAASSRLTWRPCRFKWTRPFRRKTKSGFCACAITFQTQSTTFYAL